MGADTSTGLWLAVIALGIYHGLNPAMGWPLAVAQGLTARRGSAVLATALPLATGHLLAMAVVLLPFAWLARFAEWNQALRIGAGALVLAFGVYKLIDRRHPRFLARVRPTQLVGWSFLMASAHGAALMLLPVTLALCGTPARGGAGAGFAVAPVAVTLLHTLATAGAGTTIAWACYRYLGLKFLRQSWFNLDTLWAASLVATGGAGFVLALG
jgi:hypothetical protein